MQRRATRLLRELRLTTTRTLFQRAGSAQTVSANSLRSPCLRACRPHHAAPLRYKLHSPQPFLSPCELFGSVT